MSGSAPPYMPLYVGDYLGDTTHLTTAEHGAYLLLLMAMWRAGGRLPADDARLARFARLQLKTWLRLKPILMPFFQIEGDGISQKRLTREMQRYATTVAQKRTAGVRSAAARSLKRQETATTAVAPPLQQPEPEPDSPSGVPPSGEGRRDRCDRRTRRLPPGWRPSPQDLEAAAGLGFDEDQVAAQLALMADHEFANPRADWSAAFRNWLRRAPRFDPSHRQGTSHERQPSRLEQRQDNLGRCLAGFDQVAGHGRRQ